MVEELWVLFGKYGFFIDVYVLVDYYIWDFWGFVYV